MINLGAEIFNFKKKDILSNMNFQKFICYILFVLIFRLDGLCQRPTYSQYMFNMFLINPAAAGSEGFTSINFSSREQWLGFGDAPVTNSISAQTRILKNSFIAKALNLRKKFSKRSSSGRVGVGVHIYNDSYGPFSQTGMQLTYAYHIPLRTYAYHIPLRQSQLSFGLSLEGYQFRVDKNKVLLKDQFDPTINNLHNQYIFDGKFGAQFTTPLMYAGFSVSDLFQSLMNFGSPTKILPTRTYWITGGYKIEINRYVMVEPSTMMKFTQKGAFQFELSPRVYYREDYWGGISYRTGADAGAIVFITGLRYKKYYFGYAYDLYLAALRTYTYGSHEFMFTMKFGENARRYRWLNRY
jgi:type IX secretion system PorP/SprF family membrane protein